MQLRELNNELRQKNLNITEYILFCLIKEKIIFPGDTVCPIEYENLLPDGSEKYLNSLSFLGKIQDLIKEPESIVLFKEIFELYPYKAGTRALRVKDFDIKTNNCKTLFKKFEKAMEKYNYDTIKKGTKNYISAFQGKEQYIVGMEVFFNQEIYMMYQDNRKKYGIII